MSTVRTVLGDVPAAELGLTYAHEHLVLDSALIAAAYPHILLDDMDRATAELAQCARAGVRTMVDAMPCAAGRGVDKLAALSRRTGVHVLAATGLHHERYYGRGHWSAQLSAGELARLFIDDIGTGVDRFDYTGPIVRRTGHRAGIIKIATDGDQLGARDRLLIAAAGLAHRATGAPVLTHCEQGRGALAQLAALGQHGVPATAVLLSHLDKVADLAYHTELAAAGAWLVYDQALRQATTDDPVTPRLIAHLLDAGYGGQVLLGTDGARRDLWRAYGGGPGLAWLATGLPALLRSRGLDAAMIDALYVDNPRRALALRAEVRR